MKKYPIRDYFKGPCKDPVTNPEWYLITKEQSLVSPVVKEKKESGMSMGCPILLVLKMQHNFGESNRDPRGVKVSPFKRWFGI